MNNNVYLKLENVKKSLAIDPVCIDLGAAFTTYLFKNKLSNDVGVKNPRL